MMKRIREASPRFKARITGVLFLLVILTGSIHRVLRSRQVGFRSGPPSGPHRGLGHDRCDAALL
jgi:hypothetical protein